MYDNGNAIGIGTATPNAFSLVDIVSTTKGVLFPRMTSAQMIAIAPTPSATGMLIYNKDSSAFCFYDGGTWNRIFSGINGGTIPWIKTGATIYTTNLTDAVGIGTTTPTRLLDVQTTGALNVISGITRGSGIAGYFEINNSTTIGTDAVFITSNASDSKALNISHTGTGGALKNCALFAQSNGLRLAAGSTNIAGYFEASGATNNFAIHTEAGNILFKNAHIKSTGSTPIITFISSSFTTTATPAIEATSTDVKGVISISSSIPITGSMSVKIKFATPYTSVPVVVISPLGNSILGTMNLKYSLEITNADFIIHILNASVGAVTNPTFNYIVIE
jgi:hypothetical protein